MPNVGKSTLYNALSNCSIPAENFPFCTIDPNSTRVHVPDERFDWLVDHHKPKSVVQPFLEIVDIAGLVKGASGGAGLGNAFLSHIKAVDGIMHVMRAFDDADVIHVEVRNDTRGNGERRTRNEERGTKKGRRATGSRRAFTFMFTFTSPKVTHFVLHATDWGWGRQKPKPKRTKNQNQEV